MTSGIKPTSGGAGGDGAGGAEGADGPFEPRYVDGGEAHSVAGADPATAGAHAAATTAAAGDDRLAALAAAIQGDAGGQAMRPEDALAELIEGSIGDDLDPTAAAELRAMMADLMANDPYLAGLARELGAAPAERRGDE